MIAFYEQTHLYVFNISHYCEKARWALDHFGIAHEVRHVMVGTHRRLAKKLGAKRGSVPFLQTHDDVIAGSDAILDWCESQPKSRPLTLVGKDSEQVRAIEKRLDDVLGVHVRRYFYSDALINSPELVRPLFSNGLPLWQRAAVTVGWSRIVPIMIKLMDLGPPRDKNHWQSWNKNWLGATVCCLTADRIFAATSGRAQI
ncbi:MAG: glutathione S-transferase N-terminal domain-containing protein [Betaproteobacteria bacterium]|nr:glutathione S-transferase N-terminal domain-containing protein [Betaproteobacteria bacterium]